MSVFVARIRDARGRSVSMLDPMVLHALHRSQPIDREALRSVVDTIEPGTARYRRHLIVITLGSARCHLSLKTGHELSVQNRPFP